MNKIIRFFYFLLIVFFTTTINFGASAQSQPDTKPFAKSPKLDPETSEMLFSYWSAAFEEVRFEQGATKEEFGVFNRFNAHELDSLQTEFSKGVWKGDIDLTNVKGYMAVRKAYITELFKKFKTIETEFPTSVEEYRIKKRPRLSADSCFPTCYNTAFQDGTFDGWYGFWGVNSSSMTAFNITGITGGYIGPQVKAGGPDPNTGNDYQLRITSGTTLDPFLAKYSHFSMPEVSPYTANYSVMLGDSTTNGKGVAILSQSFEVTSATASITYQYALFLENPSTSTHTYWQQPFFNVSVIDNSTGDTIPGCGTYHQDALVGSSTPGFTGIYYDSTGHDDTVFWKPWSIANVPLKNYVGHCVTVVFEIQDCSLGGHFGYAYVTASCNPDQVISSSPSFCGQDTIYLTAPAGYTSYSWSGNPSTGIISNDTLQTIDVDSAGTYTVVVTNTTGGVCTDTLVITVGKALGPIPTPSFHADTVCSGQSTTFINTSNDTSTATFYWDFYNIGTYQDSLVLNPTWVYTSPGTYVVKLYELNNGCGAYAYDTITVYPSVSGAFTVGAIGCAPTTVAFTNTSSGATSYSWNYGDPSSNPNDTSTILINGAHTYTASGTYTVTLIAKNGGPCPDTIRQVVTILGIPTLGIMGSDSVCSGGVDTLTASGGTSYLWEPGGQTSSSITVTVTGPSTYSCTITNACGTLDTSITVNLGSPPIALLATDKDTICSGDTVKLTGGGGGSYVWNTGATTSVIKVVPLITTTYTLHVFETSTTCQDSAVVTIYVNPSITSTVSLSADSLCAGSAVTLTVTSSGGPPSYIWSTGATTSAITVNPATTTTYYVLTAGECANDSIPVVVFVEPYPTLTITPVSDTVCKGSVISYTASGATTYLWNNGSTTNPTSYTINGDTTILVKGSNGHCSVKALQNISVYSNLVVTVPRDTICSGGKAVILVNASGGLSPYTYMWNNGVTWDSAGPITVPTPPDKYICTVTDGCGEVSSDTVYIVIRPAPAISFYASPDTVAGGGFINFVNLTTGATSYYWTLGDGSNSTTPEPFHEYNVAGTYIVWLTATNAYGCKDSASDTVYTIEELIIPNIFTPNGDGTNDVFHIEAGSMQSFDIQIYNRWGQKLFETTNSNVDWSGRSSSGELESAGTYYYIINATDYSGKTFKRDGYFELIR